MIHTCMILSPSPLQLKSVAHLPWRQMTYKFLNTIIDDLFAFVIKMPILHRLSVFRADVVFLIFLYQLKRVKRRVCRSPSGLRFLTTESEPATQYQVDGGYETWVPRPT